MDPAQAVEDYFPYLAILLTGLSALWTCVLIWVSVAYRRSHGKPIFFRDVPGAAHVQTDASGHSHRTWYTRLGGANKVLVVAVADRRLIIRPRFPFNLLFMPEIYGLEYEVPIEHITSVQPRGGRSGRVDLQFRDETYAVQSVTLYLRDPDRFLAALGMGAP